MFKLDDKLLHEVGLGGLPAHEKNRMLQHIYETLEMRVGVTLARQMTNEQLDEFEGFIDRNDEAGALKWLEANFPNYKQVVADELEKLKGEIKQSAPQILAASAQAAQMAPPSPPQPPAQQPPAGTA
jgi:predicted RNA-binding Zn ribbon-like protein